MPARPSPEALLDRLDAEVEPFPSSVLAASKEENMNSDKQAILKCIRRKAEIMKLDLKATNNPKYHDANEILSLIDLMERS